MNTQFFLDPFPVLDAKDIVLRKIRNSDAQDYFNYMSRDEMKAFLTEDNIPRDLQEAKKEVKYWSDLFIDKRSIYWAIALKENDKIIGTAGFNFISFANLRGDISYDLDPNYWGRGIMFRSIKAILSFADQILRLKRIQATVITNNNRSINMLNKCGFHQERLLEKYEFVDGKYKDYYMYGRISPSVTQT